MEPSMATIKAAIIGAVATIVAAVLAAILARRGRGPKPPVNGDSQGWQERNVEGPGPMWPQQQSFDALERLLERSSNKNRLLLLHVGTQFWCCRSEPVDWRERASDRLPRSVLGGLVPSSKRCPSPLLPLPSCRASDGYKSLVASSRRDP
jgi:hypothetical protein